MKPFEGKKKSYNEWPTTFLDYCNMKKCSKIILTDPRTLIPAVHDLVDAVFVEMRLIKLREINATIVSIRYSSTKRRPPEAAPEGKTTVNCSGDPRKVWLN